jgi:TonB-linked SusC/RagA family outer membrane protein
MKKIILGFVLLFTVAAVFAQQVSISGTIGTISDFDGLYQFKASSSDAVLVYSFIGFVNQQIPVAGKSQINVVMAEEVTGLDEVVVVGYGEMRKSDLTGSVASVSVDNATESGAPSVDQLLQGRVTGVSVKSPSGVPGGAVQVNIRGVGSMSASSQPLYVIDGMILDQGEDQQSDDSQIGVTVSNPLAFLSPEDIERMEILKDASATAIYGARGANGVILITTKKGKKDGVVNYSNSFAFADVIKYQDMLSGEEYAAYRNELNEIQGEDPYAVEDAVIEGVDWQKKFFKPTFTQKHRLSVSKNDDNSAMFMSGGYLSSEGIIENTGFERIDFRMNSSKDITDRLELISNFNVSRLENDMTVGTTSLGSNRSMIGSIIYAAPLYNEFEDESGEFQEDLTNSPTAWFDAHSDNSIEYTAVSKLALKYKISKSFNFEGRFGVDYKNKSRKRYFGQGITKGDQYKGLAENYYTENFHWVSDFLIKYNKKFGAHRVNAMVGATADQKLQHKSKLLSTGFIEDDYTKAENMNAGVNQAIEYTDDFNVKYMSALFRANYAYKNVNVTVTGRQDFSNKLGEGQKGSFFPSFATAYRLSEERFIKDLGFISNLKLRAGWGQVGNSAVPPYATIDRLKFVKSAGADGGLVTEVALDQKGNPNLTWETSQQTNVGLDLGFINNRFTLSVDAYDKRTKDQLQRVELPASSGFEYQWQNIGEVQNRGLEFGLNANVVNGKDFNVSIGGNISFNRNEIIDLGDREYFGSRLGGAEELAQPINVFRVGESVGAFLGYATDGIIQTEEEALSGPTFEKATPEAGDVKFVDQNRDEDVNGQDLVIIGDPNPDFTYGFNAEFSYKRVSLSALFTGVQGRDVFNANRAFMENFDTEAKNKYAPAYRNAWRADAPSTEYPRIGYYKTAVYTDRWVEDASYLRLSNVTLSYTIKPKNFIFENMKVYVTGTNLFTFTDYTGFDPEVDSFPNDPKLVGIDLNSFPAIQSVLFGLNVTF